MFTFDLPVPISVNRLFVSTIDGGLRKSKAYEDWQSLAVKVIGETVPADKALRGGVGVIITLPESCRLDADNAAKPILDALVHTHRIDDDRNVLVLTVMKVGDGEGAEVVVYLSPRAPMHSAAAD